MHTQGHIVISFAALLAAASSLAESPAEIFAEMDSRQRAHLSDISNYTLMKSTMGMCTLEYYEKASAQAADGSGTVEYMRMLSPGEIAERHSPDSPISNATPEDLEMAAMEMELYRPQLDALYREKMMSAGLPGGMGYLLLNPPPGQPWLSPNPSDMFGMYAEMLRGAAEGKRDDRRRAAAAKQEASVDVLAGLADQTTIVGHERIGNSDAIVLLTEGLDYTQQENGQEFTLDTLRLWVDSDRYLPLKMSMEGVVVDGGATRELLIERENSEFQSGSGCGEFTQPLRTVMRMSGVMSPEEQAQMVEAQAKLAEFKQQMAAMPPSQQDMIRKRMGPQFEMFEKMASGGGMEVVSLVLDMRCNTDVPTPEEYARTSPGSVANLCAGFAD